MEEKKGNEPSNQLGSLTLTIDQDSIRRVVAEGRLLEFAGKLGNEAAAQISSQVVDKLAEMAVGGGGNAGVQVSVSFIFEGGDFGTVPPRPKWGILRRDLFADGLLRQLATADSLR